MEFKWNERNWRQVTVVQGCESLEEPSRTSSTWAITEWGQKKRRQILIVAAASIHAEEQINKSNIIENLVPNQILLRPIPDKSCPLKMNMSAKKTSWLWAVKFWFQFKSSNYHSLHIKQYEARCSWHSQGLNISCVSTFKVFEFHQKCCQYHLFTKSLSMSLSLSLWSL